LTWSNAGGGIDGVDSVLADPRSGLVGMYREPDIADQRVPGKLAVKLEVSENIGSVGNA
jgi:hypothetical protein